MINFFRGIRQRLLTENKSALPIGRISKYLIYAIGEIVLVVIGILIALQINNNNDLRKTRIKEIHYLQNIDADLKINLIEMQRYIDIRRECIESANRIIKHMEGEPITDYSAFNADGVKIYSWQRFNQSNNTFQELINSGNLALISNDTIKNMLLDIESLYKKMKSEEDHFRFDAENLIYGPLYELMDLAPMISNFEYYVSKGQSGKDVDLSNDYFREYLNNKKLKNGFVMTKMEFSIMNGQMRRMMQLSEKLIETIEKDIDK